MALTVTKYADVDRHPVSGRKLLNQYEIIDELGRGVHGKVKLGRNVEKHQDVAIKIVDRYSKRRRLGKLGDPEENVKREVAILKKAIHPNVVALLEVIDDPAKRKVYIVLEFVSRGEIEWRTKGVEEICQTERRRVQLDAQGRDDAVVILEDERWLHRAQQRREERERERRRGSARYLPDIGPSYWSLEHGGGDTDECSAAPSETTHSSSPATPASRSRTHSRSRPVSEADGSEGGLPLERSLVSRRPLSTFSTTFSNPSLPARHAMLTGVGVGVGAIDPVPARAGSATGSFMSKWSTELPLEPFEAEYSYVPCLTIDQARRAFRDTVLGLEYLHYQGIIHRDIKPANLLWTVDHRVKISDFGVSYLGRPIRDDDGDGEDLSEADARPLDEAVELAKTVGTPAFYAPELCWTELTGPRPPVTGQIDIWALGVTLYCLVYARIPFLAENEYMLFRAISVDEVHLPRQRLVPVRPHPESEQPPAALVGPDYRLPDRLEYEDVDDDLRDLLARLLEKDPTKRITLREIKRHPFTLAGLADVVRWIDDTDPARQYAGKRIEVSTEDVERAVVPIGFLARMRSGMRKMGAAIGLGAAREGRRRAKSNAASSDGTASHASSTSLTPTVREDRRRSVRLDSHDDDDDVAVLPFYVLTPLSRSVVVTPEAVIRPDPFRDPIRPATTTATATATTTIIPANDEDRKGPTDVVVGLGVVSSPSRWIHERPDGLERTLTGSTTSTATVVPGLIADRWARATPPLPSPSLPEQLTAIGAVGSSDILAAARRPSGRDGGGHGGRIAYGSSSSSEREGRAPSVDFVRNLLEESRGEPSIALSKAFVMGVVDPSTHVDRGRSPTASVGRGPHRPPGPSNWLSMPLPSRRVPDSLPHGRLASAPTTPGWPFPMTSERRHSAIHPDRNVLARELQAETSARTREAAYRPRRRGSDQPRVDANHRHPSMTGFPVGGGLSALIPNMDPSRYPRSTVHRTTLEQRPDEPLSASSADPAPTGQTLASSSSEDPFTPGISQPNSFPSMPSLSSMESARTSVSVDDSLRHGKADSSPGAALLISPVLSDDEAGYYGDYARATDDDDDDDDDSDGDEGDCLVLNSGSSPSTVERTASVISH